MKISKFGWQYRTHSGFTLIEVLVAVFISTMILGVLYASFFQIMKAKSRVEDELELLHEARVIISRLNNDITSSYPRGYIYNKTRGYPYNYFVGTIDGTNSKLSFSTLSRLPTHYTRESDQSEVIYYTLPTEEDENMYILMRRENPWFGNDDGGNQYPISVRVKEFKIRYLPVLPPNSLQGVAEYVEEWDSTTYSNLPRAIELNLTLAADDENEFSYNSLISIPINN